MSLPSAGAHEPYKKPELSMISMKTPVRYLQERFGKEELDRFLAETGLDRSYLDDPNNWVSFDLSHRLFRRLVELAGDERVCIDAGTRLWSRESLGRAVWIAVKALGRPSMVYRRVFALAQIYNRVGEFKILEMERNRLVLEYKPKEGYREKDKCFCYYRIGNFIAIPTIWGLPPARFHETRCNAEGEEACTYEFIWQGKRDHVYPLAGMALGAGLSFVHLRALPGSPGPAFWTTGALLLLSGWMAGQIVRLRKALSENRKVSKEQQEALEASLANISDKYVELQESNRALEEAHRELTLHKEHLEELVRERTRELEQSKAQLEASYEKLQTLDKMKMRFFNNISHELRTPLALTLGPVEAMLQGDMGPLQEKQKAYLINVHTNALRLLKLINNLLDLAKLEEGKMTLEYGRYNLTEFIRGIVDSFQAASERRGIELRAEGAEDLPEICFDRDKIEKVLINLVGNALKFTPEGGSVVVRWNVGPEAVRVSVEDTGPGIPEEALDRIFDRFVQADDSSSRVHGGTGIGLALAKEITELHGGAIEAANRPEGGAVFSFTLPLVDMETVPKEGVEVREDGWTRSIFREADYVEEVERGNGKPPKGAVPVGQDAAGQSEEGTPGGRPTVLVVEDNVDMRGFLADSISHAFHVLTAVDGEDGWHKVREALPDIVVSDIMMPNRNGYELCAAIKKDPRLQHIPVLLLSSKSEVAMKVEGFEQGADDYLTKPFNPRELIARIKNLIRVRRLEKEVRERNRQLEKTLDELKEAQAQLVHSEKMASVGLLSAGLVHEINNPLNAAISSIRTLATSLRQLQRGESTPQELSAKLARASQRALHGLKRCEEIITSLRQFSRKDVEGKKEEDIHQGLDSTIRLLPEEEGKRIAIHRDYRFHGKVWCHLGQMNQVFLNLLTNAFHAIEGEGDIWIRTEQVGGEVVITIEDNGRGMPPEVARRIFEPFYTTKEVGKGTGLGLSISHRIVEDHGGRIEVRSTPGLGTAFSVHLPLDPPGAAEEEPKRGGEGKAPEAASL